MNGDRYLMLGKAVAATTGAVSRAIFFVRRHSLPGKVDLASPPNADRLFVTLEVEKRALFDGSNNQPSSAEGVLSGTERDIVNYHRKLRYRARGKVQRLAAKLLAAAKRVDPSEVMDRIRDMPSKCQNKIDRVRAEFDTKLELLHAQESYEQQRLVDSDEQSQDDDSGGAAIKAFCLVIMLAVAGLAYYALGSEDLWGGDVGSLLNTEAAIAIAIIAVAVPFLMTVAASKSVSVNLNRKRLTFRLAMLLAAALLGLVAFSCAHLITVSADASVDGAAEFSAVFNSMTTEPGAFRGDANALKGFFIVIVTGLLGFVLGNLSSDTDSRNDQLRAASLSARECREKLARHIRKQVNGIIDAAEKDIDRSANSLQKQFKKLSLLVEQAKDTQARYDDYLTGIEESCNLLLERYRQANAAARNTAIPPSFSEQISFRLEGASRKTFFEDGIERHRQAKIDMKDFCETVANAKLKIRNLNRDTIHSLGAVEAHEETNESYAYT